MALIHWAPRWAKGRCCCTFGAVRMRFARRSGVAQPAASNAEIASTANMLPRTESTPSLRILFEGRGLTLLRNRLSGGSRFLDRVVRPQLSNDRRQFFQNIIDLSLRIVDP